MGADPVTWIWKEGEAVTATAETTDWTRIEVFELLTMCEGTACHVLSSRYRKGKRTKIDSIHFAVDDDNCTLATKDVDGLINFNIINSYGLSPLEFLRTHSTDQRSNIKMKRRETNYKPLITVQ